MLLLKKNSNFEVSFFGIGEEIWLWRNSENGTSRLTGGRGIGIGRWSLAESHRRGRTAEIRYERKYQRLRLDGNLISCVSWSLSPLSQIFSPLEDKAGRV